MQDSWWKQPAVSSPSRSLSRTSYLSRASSNQAREVDFQFFIHQEAVYPPWWTRRGVTEWFRNLPDDHLWNWYICGCVLLGVVWTLAQFEGIYLYIIDAIYNISYAIHMFATGYNYVTEMEQFRVTYWVAFGFLLDVATFAHYAKSSVSYFKLYMYYLRFHRPFTYLWHLNDQNLKGSILGTAMKYCYIFIMLRITFAYVWLHVAKIGPSYYLSDTIVLNQTEVKRTNDPVDPVGDFMTAFYIISKMFIPVGSIFPVNDVERIVSFLIMLTGCLMVSGSAVASLSLIISLYMSPEETFRSRYKLMMKEMVDTHVPPNLCAKVKTFYKMYWHRQRGVLRTQLLPTFPPTLPATINLDIYFEATQKSRILRDLPHQMLTELAKQMETIHFIPGDTIIKRGSKKCKIIYITYGDVEMLTAEDDITAILRLTRGTVLTPYGATVAPALSVSHLNVRAATFCTAHVLKASVLWRVVLKHSVTKNHSGSILTSFTDHVERVKRHYNMKMPDLYVRKSSILQFNRNLMSLKGIKDHRGNPLLASSDIFLEIAGCYIMRNRPDATLTDQADKICLRPTFPCILQPNSSLLVAWNDFVAFLILICCVAHPYNLIFAKDRSLGFMFFDVAVTVVFILDHLVYLATGANVEEGVPITFSQTSSQQMRNHWFLLDVVATLPIFELIGDGHFGGINKLLRIPKLFRVLKAIEDSCVYRANVIRFLSYTLLLLIACYLIAAMQQGFMCFQAGYCLVTNLTHSPFWEHKPLDDETIAHRIIFGLYWSISMISFTSHRQTWSATDWKHVMYTLVILEMCVILRIFMEAVYSATIMVTTALRENYSARIAMVNNFLIRNEVDPLLMKRFIAYLQLCWHTDKAYKITHKKHSNIFYDLPEHVYQDIVGRKRSMYILAIPFMRVVNREYIKAVTSSVKLFYSSPNEILLNTGELTNEIYVIKQGICEILDPTSRKVIGRLSYKNHFGGLICLLRLPAYYTIRAVTHVQVMCIPMKALAKALTDPQIIQAINYVKKSPEFQRLQTPTPSFVTYVLPPPTSNLMHFKLLKKHEPDTEFQGPFDKLEYLSILRYVFPRYTIRPDGKYLMRYEWFRMTCALCSMQLFPHYTYLVLQWPYLYYISLILDLTAYFDIFQRMLVGYFNEKGILVYHPFSTASNYMKGGFITDLFGCLPLENLESIRTDFYKDMLRVTPTKQFLMLNRLIQLYRMPGAMTILRDYIERRDILLVMQAIPLFMAILNITTCFMVFYSVKIYYSETDDGYKWRIEPFDDHGGSWMILFKDTFRFNLTSTPWNMHLATYFWAVYECSTTGYSVFQPSNQYLMRVLFIGMASTRMISTYYLVRIISIRANVNKSLAGFKQHMKDIKEYMTREKLEPELQKELQRFYEYNWEKMGGIDYRGVLKLCDQITLRTDAILHIYGPTFAKCPILANAEVSLLRIIGRAVRSVYFLRGMTIIEHDDMVTDMYIVTYGGVEVIITNDDMDTVLRLPRGSVFGNLEGTATHRSPYSVVATSRLHLLMIKSEAFSNVTKDFPAVKENLANARMGSKGMRSYILGSEATVMKINRDTHSVAPLRTKTKTSIIKYIYFQEGMVKFYLIGICMSCIYLDLYNAGYKVNSMWLLVTLYSLDFCFLMKILTRHLVPFLITNKSMRRIMLQIRRLYFKSEFSYDLISILPMELFCYAASEEQKWMWFGFLRLNRTFRIVTVYKCLRMRNECITVNLTLTTVMAVLIWFTLFVHTSTCIWYFIATVEDSLEPKSSWMYLDDGKTHCDNNYICSVYFIITTFTQNGVGDIMPKKHSEVLFVAVLMIISTMVLMIYVGEFSKVIQYQSYRSFSFYSKYLELQAFLKNNRVSDNLVTIVNKYTLHLWRENRGLQIPHFLKHAPLSLRLRVMSAAYFHHITRHHIFEDCEPAFLRQMIGCLILYTYNEGMYVVKQSEITDSMYIIHTGKVIETCEDKDEEADCRLYPAGSYFGILQGLVRNTPYTHSYQTMSKSQVLTLKLDDWEYLLKHFPHSKNTIYKHMGKLGGKGMKTGWAVSSPTTNTSELEPLFETQDAAPGPSRIPRTETHFPTETKDGAKEPHITSFDDKNQSRLKKAPTDVTKDDEQEVPVSYTLEEKQTKSQFTLEQKPAPGFVRKIAKAAKIIMGRVSDPDLMNFAGRDELLLEEDVEATEALLVQFDKARKKEIEERKIKSDKSHVFTPVKFFEEELGKLMFTLGLEEPVTEATELSKAETFEMRPLVIHDEGDTQNPEINQEKPGVDLTIRSEDSTIKSSRLVPLTDIPLITSPSYGTASTLLEATQSVHDITESQSAADTIKYAPVSLEPTLPQLSKPELTVYSLESLEKLTQSEIDPDAKSEQIITKPSETVTDKKLDTDTMQDSGASDTTEAESKVLFDLKSEEETLFSTASAPGTSKDDDNLSVAVHTEESQSAADDTTHTSVAKVPSLPQLSKLELTVYSLESLDKLIQTENDPDAKLEEIITIPTEAVIDKTLDTDTIKPSDETTTPLQDPGTFDATEAERKVLFDLKSEQETLFSSVSAPGTSKDDDNLSVAVHTQESQSAADDTTHTPVASLPQMTKSELTDLNRLTVYSLESLDKLIQTEKDPDAKSEEITTKPSEAVIDKTLDTDTIKPSGETSTPLQGPGTPDATDVEHKVLIDLKSEQETLFSSVSVPGSSKDDDNLYIAVHTQDTIDLPAETSTPLQEPGTSDATDAERKVSFDLKSEHETLFSSVSAPGTSEDDNNLSVAVHTQESQSAADDTTHASATKVLSLTKPELTMYSLESLKKLIQTENDPDAKSDGIITKPSEAVIDKTLDSDTIELQAESSTPLQEPGTSDATDAERKVSFDLKSEQETLFSSVSAPGTSKDDDNLSVAVHTQENDPDAKSEKIITKLAEVVFDKTLDSDTIELPAESSTPLQDPGTSDATDAEQKVSFDSKSEQETLLSTVSVAGPSKDDELQATESKEKTKSFIKQQDDEEKTEITSQVMFKEKDDVELMPARVLTLDSDETPTVEGDEEGSTATASTSATGTTKKDKKRYKRETMD